MTPAPDTAAVAADLTRHGHHGFAFVGPTTMDALMEAIGMVDTHLLGCHRRGSSGLWTNVDGAAGSARSRSTP